MNIFACDLNKLDNSIAWVCYYVVPNVPAQANSGTHLAQQEA